MRRSLLVPLVLISFAAGALALPTAAWSAESAPKTKAKAKAPASDASSEAPAASTPTPAPAGKPPKGVPPPANSKLAKVHEGMTPEKVRDVMGSPTSEQSYMTGKAFIPFYYGPDTGRTDWKYKGVGRVVFSRNRWSGDMKVIRIDYDPSEKG